MIKTPIYEETNLFTDKRRNGRAYICYGAPPFKEEILSVYDLVTISVPVSTLQHLGRVAHESYPDGFKDILKRLEYYDEMLTLLISNAQSDGEWKVFEILPDIIDLNSLPTQTLRNFLTEIEAQANSVDWPPECADDKAEMQQQYEPLISLISGIIRSRISGYVYLLKSASGYWKIGKTVNPDDRIKTFSVKLPFEVEYEHLITCEDHHKAEADLHARFSAKRANGEWFCLDASDIAWIKAIKYL